MVSISVSGQIELHSSPVILRLQRYLGGQRANELDAGGEDIGTRVLQLVTDNQISPLGSGEPMRLPIWIQRLAGCKVTNEEERAFLTK